MAKQHRQSNTLTRDRLTPPAMYDVVFHNDDLTTMDFVVRVLRQVFFMSAEEAVDIMLKVHNSESAVVGTYPFDIASSKARTAMSMARAEEFPLKVTIEEHSLPF